MTKKEKIKEAWDNADGLNTEIWAYHYNYESVKNRIDKDGYLRVPAGDPSDSPSYLRPPQLKGIEHNNNWIKFERLNDINLFKDKERDFVFIKTSDCNKPQIAVFSNLYKCFTDIYNNEINNITHYQVITKPEPPLY